VTLLRGGIDRDRGWRDFDVRRISAYAPGAILRSAAKKPLTFHRGEGRLTSPPSDGGPPSGSRSFFVDAKTAARLHRRVDAANDSSIANYETLDASTLANLSI
jgi:hypothetical protein